MKAGGTIPQAPNCLGTGRKKRAPINLSVREKLAPSAAGSFLCSGQAWNFCLVPSEGRRYRLMQREGKPSPAYPNAGPALLLAGLFLWSLLDDGCAWAWRTSPGPACRQEQGRARLCTASVARHMPNIFGTCSRVQRSNGRRARHRMADRLWPPDRQCPHGAGLGIFARRRYGARRRTDDRRSAALETLVADGGMSQ
jgi:hypothetical protein